MIQYKKLMMTLALLLTAVTGAWADETPLLTIESKDYTSFKSGSMTFDDKVTVTFSNTVKNYGDDWGWYSDVTASLLTVAGINGYTITSCKFYAQDGTADYTLEGESPSVYLTESKVYTDDSKSVNIGSHGVTKIEVYGYLAEAPITVEPVEGKTNEWTFAMPASNVVLTPIYSAATISHAAGTPDASETPFETLKEAFAAVQDGDVITLDWNVTLTETLKTPSTASDISFTLDFNGFVIDNTGGTNYIMIDNGCELTLTDNSTAQTGGLKCQYPIAGSNGGKVIFQGGRYSFSGSTAEQIASGWDEMASNYGWVMGDGKEFVNIENAPVDGFMVRVDWKAFELTISAGRFATFYADQNTTLAEGQNIGFYTISNISDDRTRANVTPINSNIIPANTPTLVYNSGNDQQTVKLKVTTGAVNLIVDYVEQFKGTAKKHEFTADDMDAADYYALSGGKAFAPVKGAGTLGANQCWLQFDKQEIPSARSINLVFGETTGIEAIDNGQLTIDNYYDLNGRKLNAAPTKGVYIKDGKKIVK